MAAPLVPLLLPPSPLPWELPMTNGAWAQAVSNPSYDKRGVQVLCLLGLVKKISEIPVLSCRTSGIQWEVLQPLVGLWFL